MVFGRLGLVALLAGAFLIADALRLLHAADNSCVEARSSAIEKVNNAFNPKIDKFLAFSASVKDKGSDPNHYLIVMPDGTAKPLDLVDALGKLASLKADAAKQIDDFTNNCQKGSVAPAKIIGLADSFSRAASEALPEEAAIHVNVGDILSGSPLGGDGALIPKTTRDKLVAELGVSGDLAKIIRDPKCGLFKCGAQQSPLDAALEKLVAAQVAFNNPEHMTVGRPRIVEVKLSTTLSADDLKAQLTEAGKKENASLVVGDRMSANLIGGAAFDVSPSGPQIQWISQRRVTTWDFDVTPKLPGTQYLILSFDAIITIDGKDGTRNINTLKHKIEVDVGWPETPSEWFDLGKKWFENISWLWATILIPVGVFFAGWWRHRRKKKFHRYGR